MSVNEKLKPSSSAIHSNSSKNENPEPIIKRALLSVSDKTGLVALATSLIDLGITLLSTGGTYRALNAANIPVTEVSEYTQFPEIMDGRVKTLHPKIHGAILGRSHKDAEVMAENNIQAIDLVVVNLYPFANTIQANSCTLNDAIEQIDIGGPTMVRAAAKNFSRVTVVVNPEYYQVLIETLQQNKGALTHAQRFSLAKEAFMHTAAYDSAIANYLTIPGIENDSKHPDHHQQQPQEKTDPFPRSLNLNFQHISTMRYGENPHQIAAFYKDPSCIEASVSNANVLQGKPLSYNNIADTDTALTCVKSFDEIACVIVKHANPCGVAIGKTLLEAYQRAYQTDPTSAFGGIIAFNRPLDSETASVILEQQFVEVIIAPGIPDACINILGQKPNIRVLECGPLTHDTSTVQTNTEGTADALHPQQIMSLDFKRVVGGLLIQSRDQQHISTDDLQVVTRKQPSGAEISDLLFCWTVAKFVKSNAIVYAKDKQSIGIGAGQMSRVYSAKIAGIKAADEKLTVTGSVMASDAFFPFRDGIDAAAQAGITAVIQPGGSVRDKEVIAAADEHGIAMVFTGVRHFRH